MVLLTSALRPDLRHTAKPCLRLKADVAARAVKAGRYAPSSRSSDDRKFPSETFCSLEGDLIGTNAGTFSRTNDKGL